MSIVTPFFFKRQSGVLLTTFNCRGGSCTDYAFIIYPRASTYVVESDSVLSLLEKGLEATVGLASSLPFR